MTRESPGDMKAGFTLLEVLVVLVIIALVTSIVAVRLQIPLQTAQLENAIRQVAFVDSQTRAHAREVSTACQIVYQLDHGQVFAQARGGHGARRFAFSLPGPLRLKQVWCPLLDHGTGRVQIDVSARGTSSTYAVCIEIPQSASRWLLFSGLTGQVLYPQDDADVHQILDILRASRADTH